MTMTATYLPGRGMLVDVSATSEGFSFILGEHMTVAAIERHLHEVMEWLS